MAGPTQQPRHFMQSVTCVNPVLSYSTGHLDQSGLVVLKSIDLNIGSFNTRFSGRKKK